MGMWMPFMSEMDRDRERFMKAEKEHKTREEIELEEIRNRKLSIMSFGMIGAQTVKEYKDLMLREEELKEEIKYIRWFEDFKPDIEKVFHRMFLDFLDTDKNYIRLDCKTVNEEMQTNYDGYNLNLYFFKKLLRKYGYKVEECFDSKIAPYIKIFYRWER